MEKGSSILIIDRGKCISCGICERVCPCIHSEKQMQEWKTRSGCLVHPNRGLELIEKIKQRISICEVDVAKALSFTGGMAEYSVNNPMERSIFYTTLNENGVAITLKRYVKVSISDQLIESMKCILYKLNILQRIKLIK